MLSPRDVALVERWRTEGVPLRIVLRALEDGVTSFVDRNASGTPVPASLAYFESQVDKTATLWRERTMSWDAAAQKSSPEERAGQRTALLDAAIAAVTEAGQVIEEDAIKGILRDAWRRLRQSADRGDDEPWTLIATVDADMVGAVEATMDSGTRAQVRAEAEGGVSARGGVGMSAAARATRVEEAVRAALRARFGLPDLIEVVSDVGV